MLRHVTDEEIEQRVKVLRRELGLENQNRPDMMAVIEKLTASFRHFAYQQVPRLRDAQWRGTMGCPKGRPTDA